MDAFELSLLFPIVGIIISGEAIALVIGVWLIKKGRSGWNTVRNRRYLIADLAVGFAMMLDYFLDHNVWFKLVLVLFIVTSIVTHFNRIGEFLLKKKRAFCTNKGLFFMNNLKLVLLFGLLFTLIPF